MSSETPANPWLAAPTWLVDAARLRETLDRLHAALDGAASVIATPSAGSMVHDRGRVTKSLKEILSLLDATDLKATSALSGLVREYRPEPQAGRLRELFAGLQSGLRERVLRALGPKKVELARALLSSPAPDLLRILGREAHENSHSDVIAWLLNPRRAPVVAVHALRRLVQRLDQPLEWERRLAQAIATGSLSVRREFVIARELAGADELARVDIILTGPGFILAIENKVWSREHSDQTHTYWAWMKAIGGLRGGIFLSPSGMTAACSEFKALSYLDLVDCLLEGPAMAAVGSGEVIVLGSYLKTLAREVIPVEMRAVRELPPPDPNADPDAGGGMSRQDPNADPSAGSPVDLNAHAAQVEGEDPDYTAPIDDDGDDGRWQMFESMGEQKARQEALKKPKK